MTMTDSGTQQPNTPETDSSEPVLEPSHVIGDGEPAAPPADTPAGAPRAHAVEADAAEGDAAEGDAHVADVRDAGEAGADGDERAGAGDDEAAAAAVDDDAAHDGAVGRDVAAPAPRRVSSAGVLIWVLIALLGFTLVVQLRSNDTDEGLAGYRQEDLVQFLADLESREQRLADEISTLEESERQLTSGVQGRQVALAEAEKRADELGLLAGTLPARGPGLL
ncbi:MAG TPA: hypothetical protein VFO77_14040, partial [Actinoplanes sp.]|nr:hypothetical protein [Actinoplanes sp.]